MIYIIHYTVYNVYYSYTYTLYIYIYIYFEAQARDFENIFEVLIIISLYLNPYNTSYPNLYTKSYPSTYDIPKPVPKR